jgi:hypothetical protein
MAVIVERVGGWRLSKEEVVARESGAGFGRWELAGRTLWAVRLPTTQTHTALPANWMTLMQVRAVPYQHASRYYGAPQRIPPPSTSPSTLSD